MKRHLGTFAVCTLFILVVLGATLGTLSRFGGYEISVGNLVLRAQHGTTFPLIAPIDSSKTNSTVSEANLDVGISRPRNVIVFVGDGMGVGHVSAASSLLNGPDKDLAMTRTAHLGLMTTWAFDNLSPDSASTGTAMATGFRTRKTAVGVLEDGRAARNLFEVARKKGLTIGVITTSGLVDATPATFTTHVDSRDDYHEIFRQMLGSGTDILIGGDWSQKKKAQKNQEYKDLIVRAETIGLDHGYNVIRDPELLGSANLPVLGLYPPRPESSVDYGPPLGETLGSILELVGVNPNGYLLLVENETTDEMAHNNDIAAVLRGMQELDEAVALALERTAAADDTLVLVTADHDTGTLAVVDGEFAKGRAKVRWASGDHSSQWVPLFAFGPGAESFTGVFDNTELATRIAHVLGLEPLPQLANSETN